jgi:dipeptidyl aminopeptidase/acylaminoacyl peptidase
VLHQEPRDLTPGDRDVPPFHLGGQDMYAISPDGQELAYTSNIDEVEATSTNNEIFIVPMNGPALAGKKISTSPGSDSTPLYSPDGKYIAWRSQARAGFEADKWRLILQDRQSDETRNLTERFDHSVGSCTWLDSNSIIFSAEDHGETPIWIALAAGPQRGHIAQIEPKRRSIHADDLVWVNGTLFFSQMSARAPNEIWKHDFEGPHDQEGRFEPTRSCSRPAATWW